MSRTSQQAEQTRDETESAVTKVLDARLRGPETIEDPIYVPYKGRTLKIVDRKNDPLEPPRHKFVKAPEKPVAPVSEYKPPAPKPTQQELEQWSIPRTPSAWKNPTGKLQTVEQRIANDPRSNLPAPKPNINKIAQFNAALISAEDQMREEVNARKEEKSRIEELERRANETRLRRLRDKRDSNHSSSASAPTRRVRDDVKVLRTEDYDTRLYAMAKRATKSPYDRPLFNSKPVSDIYLPKTSKGESTKERKIEFEQ